MGMEFELKISPTRADDPSSTFELQLAKATATPFFCSNETPSMFILTAKLTGFARDDIVITINGNGTRVEIGWGQPVQKMEITRWMYKKETETRKFKKIFRIPDGVILDEIKATYNDEESILKILMPKLVDGILGVGIEEVKEQEVGEAAFESQDYDAEEIPHSTAELETLETGRKTRLVEDDNHENEEDDAANGEFVGENAEPEAFSKIEYVAETPQEEIEKLKSDETEDIDGVSNDYSESEQLENVATKTTEIEATRENVNGEIKVPKVRSMEGIEVTEETSQGTAHNGKITTKINKQPDVKTQSQASIDREAQVLDREFSRPDRQTQAEQRKQETYKNVRELEELETNKEPEDTESPYLQSPAHEHEEKGVDQQGKKIETEDDKAREECKSPQETHEDSSKEAKQEKKKDPKQFKMRTPIIIAGSALLASLVIVVFNLVKSKRREKNMRG